MALNSTGPGQLPCSACQLRRGGLLNNGPLRCPASRLCRLWSRGPVSHSPQYTLCSPALAGACEFQQRLSRTRALRSPQRSKHSLPSICSTAASASDFTASQPEGSGGPDIPASSRNTSQPQADNQPSFLYLLNARVCIEDKLREQDYMQSMISLGRHLFARAHASTARSVFLTWLGLPFLVNYLNVRFVVQLLAGFHRERVIRLRLLRWVARRSAVRKLSKASQADPANADK